MPGEGNTDGDALGKGKPSVRVTANRPPHTVTLLSMEGDSFVVDSSAIVVSDLLKTMVEGGDEVKEIPLPNTHGKVVAKVVEFCEHYQTESMAQLPKPIPHGMTVGDHVQEWYAKFVGGLDDEMLFEVFLTANYLDLAPLLELCAATVALRMINKTPDEIRVEFSIKEAFSPEVERKLREENKWSTEPPFSH